MCIIAVSAHYVVVSLSSKQGAERDQLEISTSTSIDSPTVTDLKNPYYRKKIVLNHLKRGLEHHCT